MPLGKSLCEFAESDSDLSHRHPLPGAAGADAATGEPGGGAGGASRSFPPVVERRATSLAGCRRALPGGAIGQGGHARREGRVRHGARPSSVQGGAGGQGSGCEGVRHEGRAEAAQEAPGGAAEAPGGGRWGRAAPAQEAAQGAAAGTPGDQGLTVPLPRPTGAGVPGGRGWGVGVERPRGPWETWPPARPRAVRHPGAAEAP